MNIWLAFYCSLSEISTLVPGHLKIVHYGDVYVKHSITITNVDLYEKRFEFLVSELLEVKADTLVLGNSCYNVEELLRLWEQLKKNNIKLNTVFCPTEKVISDRMEKAIAENYGLALRAGQSDQEIQLEFVRLKKEIEKVIEFCAISEINVRRV